MKRNQKGSVVFNRAAVPRAVARWRRCCRKTLLHSGIKHINSAVNLLTGVKGQCAAAASTTQRFFIHVKNRPFSVNPPSWPSSSRSSYRNTCSAALLLTDCRSDSKPLSPRQECSVFVFLSVLKLNVGESPASSFSCANGCRVTAALPAGTCPTRLRGAPEDERICFCSPRTFLDRCRFVFVTHITKMSRCPRGKMVFLKAE